MKGFVRRLGPAILVALASMATVTIATPAVSKADCADGEWWDPTGKVCRPLGVGPQPLACDPGQWWDQPPTSADRSASAHSRWHATTAGGGTRAPTNAARRPADSNIGFGAVRSFIRSGSAVRHGASVDVCRMDTPVLWSRCHVSTPNSV